MHAYRLSRGIDPRAIRRGPRLVRLGARRVGGCQRFRYRRLCRRIGGEYRNGCGVQSGGDTAYARPWVQSEARGRSSRRGWDVGLIDPTERDFGDLRHYR